MIRWQDIVAVKMERILAFTRMMDVEMERGGWMDERMHVWMDRRVDG